MAKEFLIDILTPRRKVADLRAEEAIIPAYDGERGFLADHAHFIGVLGTGVLKVRRGSEEELCLLKAGVFEFSENRLVLLADLLERAGEVDASAASERVAEIDKIFANHAEYDPEQGESLREERQLNAARLLVAAGGK